MAIMLSFLDTSYSRSGSAAAEDENAYLTSNLKRISTDG